MSKPTSTISSAVSIRVSNDLLDSIREYAIAHNLINNSGRPDKRGEPNLSQAFSELVRLGLGQEITVSDSMSNLANNDLRDIVKNLSDSVSILSDKLEERESHLEAVLSQVENLRLDVHSVKTDDLLYENLRTNLTVLQGKVAILETRTEATAPSKKATDAVSKEESVNSLERDTLPIIEAIANIAAPPIEKTLPDKTLRDNTAAPKKPKATKQSPKSNTQARNYSLVQINRAIGLEKMKELGLEEIPKTSNEFAILYPDHFEYEAKYKKLSWKKPKA